MKRNKCCWYEGIFTPGARCMLYHDANLTPAGYSRQLTSVVSLPSESGMSVKYQKSRPFGLCLWSVIMKRVKELDVRLLQRICLFFCFKLGWTHMQARAALHIVFANNLLHPSRTRRWFQAFRNGRTTLVDLQRAHRCKSARTPGNIQAVRT